MATPGFSAQHSLQLPTVTYYSTSAPEGRNYVSPVFLGEIGEGIEEAAESVAEGVTELVENIGTAGSALAQSIQSAFNSIGSFVSGAALAQFCNNFVTQALTCNNNSPLMSALDMTNACFQQTAEDPEASVICPALGPATYALAQLYCQNPSQSITPFLQQACPASS
jgi:hypothetical protein